MLSCFVLISLTVTKIYFNLPNDDIIQVLINDNQVQDDFRLIISPDDEVESIEANNNQTFEAQNNMSLNHVPTRHDNIALNAIDNETNSEYIALFINYYSSVAATCQSLNTNAIQCLNDIHSQYLSDPLQLQRGIYYISRLNHAYEQYLANSYYDRVIADINFQRLIEELTRLDNDFDISHGGNIIHQYSVLFDNLFIHSDEMRALNTIYTQCSNAIFNNQEMRTLDYQILNEIDNQILDSFIRPFGDNLNSQYIYEMVYQQFMDDNCIEFHGVSYRSYTMNTINHEMSSDNEENIDYFRSLYHTFLNELNTRYLYAIQEHLESLNEPFQTELYRVYIRSINNLHFGPYIYQYLNMIYLHCINRNIIDLNLNITNK